MTSPSPKLLESLVCPLTKTALIYDRTKGELISKAARLAFPIRGGVPVLCPDAARDLSDDTQALPQPPERAQ